MKRTIRFFLTLIISCAFYQASPQTWMWCRQSTGGSGPSQVYAISADTSHNAYISGGFGGTQSFGSQYVYNGGAFLVKYNSSGNAVWARQSVVPTSGTCYSYATAADGFNNVFSSGYVYNSSIFGTYTLTTPFACSFHTKYDQNGNLQWAKQSVSGSPYSGALARGVSADGYGNSYVAGYFNDTISFGTFSLVATPSSSYFLTKYDPAGNELWARSPSGSGWSQAFACCSDKAGNTFVTGPFGGTTVLGTYTLTSPGSLQNAFIAKFDPAGNVLWARQTLTSIKGEGMSVAVDAAGNSYVTGAFQGTLSIGTSSVVTGNNDNGYLAKFDSNGNLLWLRQTQNYDSNNWFPFSVAAGNHKVYISGGNCNVMPAYAAVGIGSYSLSLNPGGDVMYLFELDDNGNTLCGSMEYTGGVFTNALACDTVRNMVYFGAAVYNNAVIGTDTVKITTHKLPMVAKWKPCLSPLGIEEYGGAQSAAAIRPNPGNGVFEIHAGSAQPAELIIIDQLGRTVHRQRLDAGATTVHAEHLSKGVYTYMVEGRKGKLVVE